MRKNKLNLSKNVRDGMIVSLRGGKYIRCGKRATPAGVYHWEDCLTIITDDGIKTVSIPEGIVCKGRCNVLIG